MPGITIRVSHTVSDRIPKDAGARLNAEMRAAIASSTRAMYAMSQANINKRTGRTAGTIGSSVRGGGSRATGYVGSDDRIATYLELGTRPHIIRPVRARALYWPGAAHPVRQVNHPGTRPYRWLRRSGQSAGPIAKAQLRAAFASVFG